MIDYFEKELIKVNNYHKNEIEDVAGIKMYLLALLLTILFIPFRILYYLILQPI